MHRPSRWTIVAGVTALWLIAAVVMGMQATLGAALQGQDAALWPAVRSGLIQTLPWIPVTLAVVALAARFRLSGPRRWRNGLVHVVAIPLVAWLANVGVVLGFWATGGTMGSLGDLVGAAAYWATLRLHVAAVLYAAIAGLTWVALQRQELRARELAVARREGQLATARLQALTAQIRPHFLFNTLHAIGQMWRSGRADEADAMLDHLGALFQRVRALGDEVTVPLDDELRMVLDYLAIEEARFSDRLAVELDVADGARSFPVPPLVLQPLVENAVRHGISRTAAGGTVRVGADLDGDRLVLEVTDDGPGLEGTSPAAGSGTGMRNVRDRLSEIYGGEASLDVTSDGDGKGVRVRMVLPRRTGEVAP